jgi:hypothetical protein
MSFTTPQQNAVHLSEDTDLYTNLNATGQRAKPGGAECDALVHGIQISEGIVKRGKKRGQLFLFGLFKEIDEEELEDLVKQGLCHRVYSMCPHGALYYLEERLKDEVFDIPDSGFPIMPSASKAKDHFAGTSTLGGLPLLNRLRYTDKAEKASVEITETSPWKSTYPYKGNIILSGVGLFPGCKLHTDWVGLSTRRLTTGHELLLYKQTFADRYHPNSSSSEESSSEVASDTGSVVKQDRKRARSAEVERLTRVTNRYPVARGSGVGNDVLLGSGFEEMGRRFDQVVEYLVEQKEAMAVRDKALLSLIEALEDPKQVENYPGRFAIGHVVDELMGLGGERTGPTDGMPNTGSSESSGSGKPVVSVAPPVAQVSSGSTEVSADVVKEMARVIEEHVAPVESKVAAREDTAAVVMIETGPETSTEAATVATVTDSVKL